MRRILFSLLLACSLGAPLTAHADDAAVAEAQARFREGLSLADRSKFDEARLKFLQAYSVVKAPSVAFNLALAEQKSGHEIDAVNHFRLFLVIGASDTHVTDAMRDRARASIADLAKKVGQIAIEVPAEAKVSLDGAPVDSVKDPIAVSDGKHRVDATYGGRAKSTAVETRAGEVATATLTFDEPSLSPPPAPMPATEPPPEPPPQSRWTTARIATVSGLGAGAVAGVVLAVVFHGKAGDKVDESKDLLKGGSCVGQTSAICTQAASLKDDRDSADTASTVSVVAAGVLGAGAIAAAIFWPKSRSTTGRIVPEVSPGYGGMKLVGRF